MGERDTPVNKPSERRLQGKRRGLGPGGTRGTIELLCRGGGGIAALEAPTVVGYKTPNLGYSWNHSLCFFYR